MKIVVRIDIEYLTGVVMGFKYYLYLLIILIVSSCTHSSQSNKRKFSMNNQVYDAVIIGGSHAGLSAAMSLGRMGRTVLVIDDGKPRNKPALHANNISGFDGENPDLIREKAKSDLRKYKTVHFLNKRVKSVNKKEALFYSFFENDKPIKARKVILAFGVKDTLPKLEGIDSLWGKSVFHCPYCHGYEYKNKKIGILASGKFLEHLTPMVNSLTSKIVLFLNGELEISTEFEKQIKNRNIPLYTKDIVSIEYSNSEISKVHLDDSTQVELEAMLIGPTLPFKLNTSIAWDLGCEKTKIGLIKVDNLGKTSIDGVFAAGDIMGMHSVASAIASGQLAGSGAVSELVHEDFYKD